MTAIGTVRRKANEPEAIARIAIVDPLEIGDSVWLGHNRIL
jgi:hypothetical protein